MIDIDDDVNLKKLQKIQSHCRKIHVQKELIKIRNEYESIFNEIEGVESDLKVVWPNESIPICYPKFVSKKQSLKSSASKIVSLKTPILKDEKRDSALKDFNQIDDIEKINYLELDNLKKMSKTELISVRESVSLEMLWIQQAIQSRIQYLKLKKNLENQRMITKLSNQ